MSLKTRQEYLATMRKRYEKVETRADKSRIVDEVVVRGGASFLP